MDKDYIINLIDEINKIELGTIVEITKYDETHKYEVKYDPNFEDIELISLDEKDSIWGSCGETIEEVRSDLLCGGIREHYQSITIVEEETND